MGISRHNSEFQDQLDRIFLDAVRLPTDQQEAFVRESCLDDAVLCASVLKLLSESEASETFLERPLGDRTIIGSLVTSGETQSPEQVGAFRIVEEIGRGGLGVVYLAERIEGGFDQRVALKLIRPGMDTSHVVRRFETERSLLASFQHPNIAQLVDGGLTPDGRPFFAMEYIDGRPITRYCSEQRLGLRERLGLFLTVCKAVQYAHTNLVVHRDLKPSNILVYADDAGRPVAKLLDFGIAKIVSAEPGSDDTQTAIRAFTPGYAAPEQIRGLTPNVTTDVYSLGVVLYELIAGRKPFETKGKSALEIEQEILETEPTRPTVAMASPEPDAVLLKIGSSRKRDLDLIVMKAIRRDPDRRYPSAAMLAADVESFLAGHTVAARPDSWTYRANRFVRRNAIGVGLASLFVAALIAAVVGTAWQAQIAETERDGKILEADRANATLDFVLGVFESANPSATQGAPVTALTIVDAAVDQLAEWDEQPRTHAQMSAAVGRLSYTLGLPSVADSLWNESLQARRALLEPDDPEIAESLIGLAKAREDVNPAGAIELLREAIEIRESNYGPSHELTVESLNNLATSLYKNGDNEAALAQFNRLLDNMGSEWRQHPVRAQSLYGKGQVLSALQRADEAEIAVEEALAIRKVSLGEKDPLTLYALYALAEARRKQGKYELAKESYLALIPAYREVLGERHGQVANALTALGLVDLELSAFDESLQSFEEAYEIYRETWGPDHGYVAIPIANKGRVLRAAGRTDEAIATLTDAIERYRRAFGSDYTRLAHAEVWLARAYTDAGDYDAASRVLEHASAVMATKPHRTDIAKEIQDATAVLDQLSSR